MILRKPTELASGDAFEGVRSVADLLDRRSELTPRGIAYVERDAQGRWRETTWSAFRSDAWRLARWFSERGIGRGARVAILGATSIRWDLAQMSALGCGALVAGIDPYYPDETIDRLVDDLNPAALLVDDARMLERLSPATKDAISLIVFLRSDAKSFPGIATLECAIDVIDGANWKPLAQPRDAAVVAFSSGTQGMPKPVVFSHAQVLHACKSILDAYPEVESGVRLICWLPLANLFQRIINFCSIVKGGTSYVVGQPQQVMEAVAFANPQVFIAVPRFCERLHAGIMSRVRASPILARVVETSIALNAARLAADKSGLRLSRARRITAMIADRIVLARLRYAMGRDLQFIVTGSAPMPRWLLERLAAMGIVVLEAYGVSENLVPVAANRLRSHKLGTVGKPIGDNEVRVAADGEILVRGVGVFSPAFEMNVARSQALTDDGFLATGDLGAFDADGFLVLHGRRGEAFKDARGRWIAPSHIEAALRRVGGIEHAAVLRLRDDRLVGILSIDRAATGLRRDESSLSSEIENRTALELLDRLDGALASLPIALRPRGYLVVRAGFSIATGELTTNLKLRRQSLTTRLAKPLRDLDDQLDGMSASTSRPILRFV